MQALRISTSLNLSAIALKRSKVWSETHISVSCIVGGENSLLSEKLGFNFEVGNTAFFFSVCLCYFSQTVAPKLLFLQKQNYRARSKSKSKRELHTERNNFREQNRRAGAFYSVLTKWDFQVLRKCNCKIMSAFAINTMGWFFFVIASTKILSVSSTVSQWCFWKQSPLDVVSLAFGRQGLRRQDLGTG